MTSSTITPPETTRSRAPSLAGISLGYFMILMDMTVLSVAEPDLARSLGGSVAGLQWAVTGYTVAFAALLLSAGAVADRYGAHRVFRAGIILFGLGSLLSAAAPNLWTLVALRALLGIAAAAAVPASMAMVTRLYPDPARRAKAVSIWAATSGAALAAGPIAGGLLVELAGWRAIFLINVPLAVLVLALTAGSQVICPRSDRPIDWTAQFAAFATLALLTGALIDHAIWPGVAALAAAAAFGWAERRSATPVLAPAVLRAPRMAASLLAGAAVNFTMTGVLFVLPLLFQHALTYGPLATGLAFLPMTVPFAVNPLLTGRIVARAGPRPPVLLGLSLLLAGPGWVGVCALAGAGYLPYVPGLLMIGFGVSFSLPALVATVVAAAPAGMAGAAGGLLNAVRQVGATFGVAVLGTFVSVQGGGAGWALLLAAVTSGAAGLALRCWT